MDDASVEVLQDKGEEKVILMDETIKFLKQKFSEYYKNNERICSASIPTAWRNVVNANLPE